MRINTNIVQLPTPIIRYCGNSYQFFKQIATMICTVGEINMKPDQFFDEIEHFEDKLRPHIIFIQEDGTVRYPSGDWAEDDFPMVAFEGETILTDNYFFLDAVYKTMLYEDVIKANEALDIQTSRLNKLGIKTAKGFKGDLIYEMPIDLSMNYNGDPFFHVEPGEGIPFEASFDKSVPETSESIARTIYDSVYKLLSCVCVKNKIQIRCTIQNTITDTEQPKQFPDWINEKNILRWLKKLNTGNLEFV